MKHSYKEGCEKTSQYVNACGVLKMHTSNVFSLSFFFPPPPPQGWSAQPTICFSGNEGVRRTSYCWHKAILTHFKADKSQSFNLNLLFFFFPYSYYRESPSLVRKIEMKSGISPLVSLMLPVIIPTEALTASNSSAPGKGSKKHQFRYRKGFQIKIEL